MMNVTDKFRASLVRMAEVTDVDRYRAARFLLIRAIERAEEGTLRGQIASKALQYAAEELTKGTAFDIEELKRESNDA